MFHTALVIALAVLACVMHLFHVDGYLVAHFVADMAHDHHHTRHLAVLGHGH